VKLAPATGRALLALSLLAGLPHRSAAGETPTSAERRTVRCLLVAPLENASDLPDGAQAAHQALVSFAGADRERILSGSDLRAVFQGTSLELAEGVPASLAVELAEVLGADGVLYGAVEGQASGPHPTLTLSLRLALSGTRELLLVESSPVAAVAGERPLVALRRTAAATGRRAMALVGGPRPSAGCFDPDRLSRVRQAALPAAPGAPPPAAAGWNGTAVAEPPASHPAPPPPATARQAEWAWRLGARDRFALEGIAFEGRSARLLRDAGLEELAGALRAAPAVRVRLEGFVDSSRRPDEDARLSLSMAEAAGERLVELGVPRERLSWTGRGGDAPLLPNYTARARAGNRRVEVVALPETASHP
jgi:outer membrane protein OmpA-like peptidoglycan-associated protein